MHSLYAALPHSAAPAAGALTCISTKDRYMLMQA